jgi:hypothetical protein
MDVDLGMALGIGLATGLGMGADDMGADDMGAGIVADIGTHHRHSYRR